MPVRSRLAVFVVLLAVMAITRVGHFGSVVSLPDASLAVFLLGGLWLGGLRGFAAYAVVAFGIDVYLAQTATEVGWCLTPAYAGLVLSYAALWLGGRYLARTPELPPLRFTVVGGTALLLAFIIANVSFWGFSGYFGEMPAFEYASRVAKYFPGYLASATLYLTLGWLAQRLLLSRAKATEQSQSPS